MTLFYNADAPSARDVEQALKELGGAATREQIESALKDANAHRITRGINLLMRSKRIKWNPNTQRYEVK